ncbi:MAG: hypothetical protein L3J81_02945, partial [Thermoplasmata archaeon]|nr:hypothetical protein [Thermoplasmata archaeon]
MAARKGVSVAKIPVIVAIAVAAVVAVVGALHAMAPGRRASDDDGRANAAAVRQNTPEPAETVATPPPSVVELTPAPTTSAPATSVSSVSEVATGSPMVAPAATAIPVRAPQSAPRGLPAGVAVQAVHSNAPAVSAPEPVDLRPDPTGGTLIMQASHALADGLTPRALALAHQAVLANPGDADAWLILGAACQASGTVPAA